MSTVLLFLENWAESIWKLLVDSAFLLLVGLFLAGILHLVLNEKIVNRFLKRGGRSDIFRAALLGIPLPLCSCSVLPVAREFHKSGVSKEAVTSFLISTPETGVDSILLTYALTDPLLTVARPVTAFLTAATAGLFESMYPDGKQVREIPADDCGDACACSSTATDAANRSLPSRIWSGIRYAFTDLLADLAPYLFFGYVLAGLVAVALGVDMLDVPEALKSGWGGYIGAIVVGLPLYICATSSTPLAAALLSLGFSPGAILVFLIVGPATNVASLVVVSKILRGWSMVRYLISIIVVAVVCGIVVDRLYDLLGVAGAYRIGEGGWQAAWLNTSAAILLAAAIIYFVLRGVARRTR